MTVRGSIAGLAEARTAKEARIIDEYCIFGEYGWCIKGCSDRQCWKVVEGVREEAEKAEILG